MRLLFAIPDRWPTVAIAYLLTFNLACSGSKSSSGDSSSSSTSTTAPTLSYSGATGTSGTTGATLSVSPTTLSANGAAITACNISPSLPAPLSINATTCVISGTPSTVLASTTYKIYAVNSVGNSSTASLTLSVAAAAVADHLVPVSGNNQSPSPGASLAPLTVQVQDQYNNPWPGGVTLGLMRMLGINGTSSEATTTTNSSGYASFPVTLGYSTEAWQIVPIGASSLPNLAGTGCGSGKGIGFSCGTKVGFTATPTTKGIGTFGTKLDFATGFNPEAIGVGDFNGDGKLDLAVTNSSTHTVSVLLGNGNGTFATQVGYPTGGASPQPQGLVIGDLNGDGILDLAMANASANDMGVLLGNGNGTFQGAVTYNTGTSPDGIIAGDFNGDGILDLAVTNTGSNTLSLFIGSESVNGTFAAQVTYPTGGTSPEGIAVGDFNGDGILDLVVVNNTSNDIGVLLGNGNGTFGAAQSYITGSAPQGITVGDFSGDGKLDLIVTNTGSNTVGVFLGNGNGTFDTATTYSTSNSPSGISAGDFGGNGILDLAVTNYGSNTVSLFTGNGNGTFKTQVTYPTDTNPKFVAIGDFTGNGKLDLSVVNYNSNKVSVFLGN